jgi:hypothetical protein
MEFALRASDFFSIPRVMCCQHPLAPITRRNHPRQTQCQNRKKFWVVALAQMELDGPALLIVCGRHRQRLMRGGGVVASEPVVPVKELPAPPVLALKLICQACGAVLWKMERDTPGFILAKAFMFRRCPTCDQTDIVAVASWPVE